MLSIWSKDMHLATLLSQLSKLATNSQPARPRVCTCARAVGSAALSHGQVGHACAYILTRPMSAGSTTRGIRTRPGCISMSSISLSLRRVVFQKNVHLGVGSDRALRPKVSLFEKKLADIPACESRRRNEKILQCCCAANGTLKPAFRTYRPLLSI